MRTDRQTDRTKLIVAFHSFAKVPKNIFKPDRIQMTIGRDNATHPQYIMDNYSYRHTFRICKTYCFSTATMVTRTHLYVTLHVYCLSCWI